MLQLRSVPCTLDSTSANIEDFPCDSSSSVLLIVSDLAMHGDALCCLYIQLVRKNK